MKEIKNCHVHHIKHLPSLASHIFDAAELTFFIISLMISNVCFSKSAGASPLSYQLISYDDLPLQRVGGERFHFYSILKCSHLDKQRSRGIKS